jgi:hypothetical protein
VVVVRGGAPAGAPCRAAGGPGSRRRPSDRADGRAGAADAGGGGPRRDEARRRPRRDLLGAGGRGSGSRSSDGGDPRPAERPRGWLRRVRDRTWDGGPSGHGPSVAVQRAGPDRDRGRRRGRRGPRPDLPRAAGVDAPPGALPGPGVPVPRLRRPAVHGGAPRPLVVPRRSDEPRQPPADLRVPPPPGARARVVREARRRRDGPVVPPGRLRYRSGPSPPAEASA